MKIFTTDEQIRQNIPNVLATVEGEPTLIEKLTPFLEMGEKWLATTFTSEDIFDAIASEPESPMYKLFVTIIANEGFRAAIPSLDLILTPNGFGIVSNTNVIPASRERVERLMTSLENNRDQALELLILHLAVYDGWQDTLQGRYFAATLFPFLGLCRRMGINEHYWEEYQQLRERLIKIENVLADTYFSQELMTTFRQHVLNRMRECNPLQEHVIQSLHSLEIMLLAEKQCHPQAFYDIVNIIREHPTEFPEWHASTIAELYSPTVFINKKSSGGYWF